MVKRSAYRKWLNRIQKRAERRLYRAEEVAPLYRTAHFLAQGASHVASGKRCQDASHSLMAHRYCLAAIADGHGGDDYCRSERGSRFAVEALEYCAKIALCRSSKRRTNANRARNLDTALLNAASEQQNEIMRHFSTSVLMHWLERLNDDLQKHPLEIDELSNVSEKTARRYAKGENLQTAYGTTLVGAIVTRKCCILLQIGDGCCVVFDQNGKTHEPVPVDNRCFLNETTSLCDNDAKHEFRFYVTEKLPAAVFVASDGVENSFGDRESLHGFFKTILQSFATDDENSAKNELDEFLPRLSAHGSCDDVSIAALFSIPAIHQNPDFFMFL